MSVQVGLSKKRNSLRQLFVLLFCIIVGFTALFPIIYMVTNSFMSSSTIMEAYSSMGKDREIVFMHFKLIPEFFTLNQYIRIFIREPFFMIMFWNSLLLAVSITLGQCIIASLAAYGFAKIRFRGSRVIFFMYIIVMLLPYQVVLVPNYIILSKLNLLDTYWAIILPGVFSTFGVFLLHQFMNAIPDEYCEAAKIDGAGHGYVFLHIILPQTKAGLASVMILCFIDCWNMVEQPLIFLKDKTMHPLSIYLSVINAYDLGIAFACGLIYMIPTILLFLYGENYLIKGIQLTGIK